MEKKQCAKCKHFLLFNCFKISKRTAQLTKCCVKCLENCKKSRQQTKCEHRRQRSQRLSCGGGYICEHKKIRQDAFFVVEVRFVNTTRENHIAFLVAEVKFVSTTGKDQNAFLVVGVKFVSTTRENQDVPYVTPWTPCWARTKQYL